MKTQTIAKAAILDPQGNVLLLRRSLTDPRRPGDWDFPGGAVEPGEDVGAGVAREIAEEAGLDIPASALRILYAGTEAYPKDGTSNTRVLFACIIDAVTAENVTLSSEHDDFIWVTVEQALQDFKHPFYNTGLRYAVDHKLLQ